MKKFLICLIILFLQTPLLMAQTLNGEISFDWISKSQMERDANIEAVKNIVFTPTLVEHYGKDFFRNIYKDKLKDKDHVDVYNKISQGITDDVDKKYCGFYWGKYLVAYGVQYKNKPNENFYYDGFGKLKWVDRYSSEYPKFPYITYQYNTNGNLKAVYYFLSNYDQYIYDEKGNFKGRWYKDKMYDGKAKIIMTRTNWED